MVNLIPSSRSRRSPRACAAWAVTRTMLSIGTAAWAETSAKTACGELAAIMMKSTPALSSARTPDMISVMYPDRSPASS